MHQGDDAVPVPDAPRISASGAASGPSSRASPVAARPPDQGDQRAVAVWPRRHRLPGRRQRLLCRAGRQAAADFAEATGLPAGRSEAIIRDARVAAALHKAGLGDFIEHLGDEGREGKTWDQVLSGGQKQKLVRRPHPAAPARPAVPRRGDRRARPRGQDRLPPGDQGQLPRHHGDQRHARSRRRRDPRPAPNSTTAS